MFLFQPHSNNRFFFLLTIKYGIFKFKKRLPNVSEYAEMWHNMIASLKHNNDLTCLLTRGCQFLNVFHRLIEIEFSHIGRISRTPDLVLENKRIYHECEGWIGKSILRIVVWHHKACQVMTNGDSEGRIFPSYPHTNNELFFCSPLNTSFYIGKTWKRLPEILEYAKMRHGDVI